MTPGHQPPCPGGRLCRIPGLAEMHNGGGHCPCGSLCHCLPPKRYENHPFFLSGQYLNLEILEIYVADLNSILRDLAWWLGLFSLATPEILIVAPVFLSRAFLF